MKTLIIFMLAMAAVVAPLRTEPQGGGKKKMVCYIGSWARYNLGDGKFVPEQTDPHLCPHLIYNFTVLKDNVISVLYSSGDPKNKSGDELGLKQQNPELKTLIAISGYNFGYRKYSEMSASPSTRKTFVDSVVAFLEKYDFDGLSLDWDYPSKKVSENTKDRENFSAVVRELREAFNRVGKGYLLTAGVTPNTKTIDVAYEVSEIARDLDFVNVMCFDYQGLYDVHDYTGHNTPLYKHPADVNFDQFFNVNDTVIYWLQAGLPKEKLILGMALHGRGFTLAKYEDHGLFAPSTGRIYSAPYSQHAGIWGYNEICETFQDFGEDWKISINEHVKAPYAFNWHNWILVTKM